MRPLGRCLADPGSAGLPSTIRQFAPIGKVDFNRSPHPNREAGQKDDREAHDEEHGAGGGVESLLLRPMTSPTQLLEPATPWKKRRMPPITQANPRTSPASE